MSLFQDINDKEAGRVEEDRVSLQNDTEMRSRLEKSYQPFCSLPATLENVKIQFLALPILFLAV